MLIEFSVANFRSVRDRQTLSMAASASKDRRESHAIATGLTGFPALLRSTAIYGANAAGKSNIVLALDFMRDFVVSSAKGQEGDEIDTLPFKFDELSPAHPSEFEAIFIATDGIRYQYGFAVTRQRVVREYLIAYPKRNPQTWIDRTYDDAKKEYKWEGGSSLKGNKTLWQTSTRDNALFLSIAIQLNSDQLKAAFSWFQTKIRVIRGTVSPSFSTSCCQDFDKKSRIISFLEAADLGIRDIELEDIEIDKAFAKFAGDLPEGLAKEFKKSLEGGKITSVRFVHEVNGRHYSLDIAYESDGTNKLFRLAGPWLDVFERGLVLVIDELHNSLHPKIVRFLVNLFHDPDINAKGAQLVMTTHDTTIMDAEVFRRDQIWFVEKDETKSTRLYPLLEFHPRKNESLEKGYLQGRYGAIPFIGELEG